MGRIKRKMDEQERKVRKNKIVIRALRYETRRRKWRNSWRRNLKLQGDKHNTKDRGEESDFIIVEMKDWETKQSVMQKKKKLGEKRIYIDHDLTEEERRVQRELRDTAKRETAKGKKTKVGYRKIKIQGK